MSIDKARKAIFGHDPWGRAYINEAALDTRIREVAREEIARLSPAPVGGGDGHCDCFGNSGLHASTHARVGSPHRHCDMCGKPVADGTVSAIDAVNIPPTPPPAEPDGGEAMRAYNYAVTLFGHLAPQCEPLDDLLGVLTQIDNATTIIPELRKTIADLEQQLAEVTTEIANLTHDLTKAFDATGDAERDLAEARKRNADLEAGLDLAAARIDRLGVNLIPGSRTYIEASEWATEARALLTPATDKGEG